MFPHQYKECFVPLSNRCGTSQYNYENHFKCIITSLGRMSLTTGIDVAIPISTERRISKETESKLNIRSMNSLWRDNTILTWSMLLYALRLVPVKWEPREVVACWNVTTKIVIRYVSARISILALLLISGVNIIILTLIGWGRWTYSSVRLGQFINDLTSPDRLLFSSLLHQFHHYTMKETVGCLLEYLK